MLEVKTVVAFGEWGLVGSELGDGNGLHLDVSGAYEARL